MPRTLGLGAFTEGLQGGMAARSKRDVSEQYKRILADRADTADRSWQDREDVDRDKWYREHSQLENPMEGYTPNVRTGHRDPALMRMFKFIGGRIKGAFGGGDVPEADFSSPTIQPSSPVQQQQQPPTAGFQQGQGIPGQQGPMQRPSMRDGGLVRGYKDGGSVDEAEALNRRSRGEDAGGLGAFITEDIPRSAADLAKSGFRNTLSEGKEYMADEAMRREQLMEGGISAAQRGERTRDYIGEGVLAIPRMATAAAKDVLSPLAPAAKFAGGFLGFDGGEEGIPASGTTASATEDPSTSEAVKTAIDAPDKSDGQIAEEAMTEGQQYALENLDYKMLVDRGVRPEDLPSMTTREWADHRSRLFQFELSRGASVKEAQQNVEFETVETQMRGMIRELDKATLYLGTGQNREAAMAIRQGFQYFPNGVSVKFGTVKDPQTGIPVIMAMGTDEETGEPTGAPMMITVDRLATLRGQMSDPKAFSAWTKDGHQLQLDIAKLEETAAHNKTMEDIYGHRAETYRATGIAAAAKSGRMTPAEERQRAKEYRTEIDQDLELSFDSPDQARALASAMSRYESMYPGVSMNDVIDTVYRAYLDDKDGMTGVETLVNPRASETGIPEG